MPFVLRNFIDGKYSGGDGSIDQARIFAKRGNAHGSTNYNKATHECVKVNIVPDNTDVIRKGEWMNLDEYQDRFGGHYFQQGEVINHSKSLIHETPDGQDYFVRADKNSLFIHQVVVPKGPNDRWCRTQLVQVYPSKDSYRG